MSFVTAQELRPRGPNGPAPTAFVAARFRRYASKTVGGWASSIVPADRRSAATPSLCDGVRRPEPFLSFNPALQASVRPDALGYRTTQADRYEMKPRRRR